MGKWQAEYEREWETFTRETLRTQFGRGYARHRVTARDKRELYDLLRSVGSSFDPFTADHEPDKVITASTSTLRPVNATSHARNRQSSAVCFQTPRSGDRLKHLSSRRTVAPQPRDSDNDEEEVAFPATQVLAYTQLDAEYHSASEDSEGHTSDTSMQSDVSYVYQTPQPKAARGSASTRRVRQRSPAAAVSSVERQHKRRLRGSLARSSTSTFPSFTPRDLHGSRDLTAAARFSGSASQTLRCRLASMSPIAAARLRFSLGNESHTTIGEDKDESAVLFVMETETGSDTRTRDGGGMQTPQPMALVRQDATAPAVNLDVSMQSMHLDEDEDDAMEGSGGGKADTRHRQVRRYQEEEEVGRIVSAALDFKGMSDDDDDDDEEGARAPPVEEKQPSPPKEMSPRITNRWHWSETTMQGESESVESHQSDARLVTDIVTTLETPNPAPPIQDVIESDDDDGLIPEPEAEEDDVTCLEEEDTCAETETVTPMHSERDRRETAIEDGNLMSTMLKNHLRNAGLPMSDEEDNGGHATATQLGLFESSTVSATKGSPTASSSSASSSSASSKSRPKPPARNLYYRTKLPLRVESTSTHVDDRRRERRQKLKKKLGSLRYNSQVPECNVDLAPYQREALEWMLEREALHTGIVKVGQVGSSSRQRELYYDRLTAKMRGGILADEMGLGKTVCCIALICESLKKFRGERSSESSSSSVSGSSSEGIPRLKAPTLIITPLSILSQWEKEIREKTNLSVISYQGHSRRQIQNVMDFMGVDVVLSTYDTLRLKECKVTKGKTRRQDSSDSQDDEASEDAGTVFDHLNDSRQWHTAARRLSNSKKPAALSKLHQLMWHRIILDESHLITNPSCARAKAALILKSKRRWCVTGTPIQNSGKDLSSLMTFLGMSHVAADLDYHEVLVRVMLRRLKSTVDADSNEPIVQLPRKQEEVLELTFTSDLEKAYYTLLHRSTKRRVFEYLRKHGRGTGGGGQFMHVFELLLRLRQCCDACTLVSDDPQGEVQGGNGALLAEIGTLARPEAALLERASVADPHPNAVRFSTKITRLLQELHIMKQNNERGLVVSQWTSFLDLIGEAIHEENARNPAAERDGTQLRFCRLDGRMSAREREQAIASFQIEYRVDILLVSIRTGGLGLNLTAASQVFIMEPSWNPSIESQAIDRAHRVGQKRRVRIVRFLMKNTIEERVVELQRKKRELATATLGDGIASSQIGTRSNSATSKETALSRDELRGLFSQDLESAGNDDDEPDDSMEGAIWDDLE